MKNIFFTGTMIVLFSCLIHSCDKPGRPVRKKVPELTSFDDILPVQAAATTGLPFFTSDIALATGGSVQRYLYVSMPDAANDSLAVGLVRSYMPLAMPLLTQWAQQERKGVVIDLRSSTYGTLQSQYLIKGPNALVIPVVLLWDQQTAGRAGEFVTLLQSVPAVTVTSSGTQSSFGRQDCFSRTSPFTAQ